MSRTRLTSNDSAMEPLKILTDYYSAVTGLTTSNEYSDEYKPVSASGTMTDVVTPQFWTRSKKGEIFNNPMSSLHVLTEDTFETIDTLNQWDHGGTYHYRGTRPVGSWFTYPTLPSITSECSAARSIAITSSHADVDISRAALLVTTGEAKESVETVAAILSRVTKFVKVIKKKRWKMIKKSLEDSITPADLADFWMFCRYGIRPMIYEILQVMDALKSDTVAGQRMTARGYQERNWTETTEADVDVHGDGSVMTLNQFYNIDYTARAGVLYDIETVGFMAIWGLNKPFESIYDLTTLSFVLDWFFNVGDTIASFTPNSGLKTLASWVTEKTVTTKTKRAQNYVGGSTATSEKNGFAFTGLASEITTEVLRTPDPERSILPRFTVNLDMAKLIDIGIIGRNLTATFRGPQWRKSALSPLRVAFQSQRR